MSDKVYHLRACISNTTNLHATSCDLSIYVPTDAEVYLNLLNNGHLYPDIQNWNNNHSKTAKGDTKPFDDSVNMNPISFEYKNREFLNMEMTRIRMQDYGYIDQENALTDTGKELATEIAFQMNSKLTTAEMLLQSFTMQCRTTLAITNICFEVVTEDESDFKGTYYLDGVTTTESRLLNSNTLQISGNKTVPEFEILSQDHALFDKLRNNCRQKLVDSTNIVTKEVLSLMKYNLGYDVKFS